MPISDKVLHAIAVQIKKDLLADEKEHDIKGTIEYFIRGRILYDDLKIIFDQFYSKKEKEYSAMLEKLVQHLKYAEIRNNYLRISIIQGDDSRGHTQIDEHKLQHKLYFTFKNPAHNTPDALKNLQAVIDGIYTTLCEIHDKLDKEFRARSIFGAVLEKGIITIKIPEKFILFIGHKDPLVIHFSDKKQEQRIKDIVQNTFGRYSIALEKRTLFGDNGYDIMDAEMKKCKASHSEIICTIVAKRIFVNKEEILRMEDDVLVERLRQEIKNAIELEYHHMYEIMRNHL